MKAFRYIFAPLLVLTLLLPAGIFMAPQTVGAAGDAFDTCPGGQCRRGGGPSATQTGGRGAGSGIQSALGPTQTVPAPAPYNVNIRNPFVGIASPVLNAIGLSTAAETGQSLFEWAQTFVLEALKKRILDMMVAEIIRWIQGGQEPRFVTDWEQFLEEAGNAAVGELAIELNLGFLCQPFSAQLQLAFSPEIEPSFANQARCTLDDIVGNIDSFYKDFSAGGWIAYQEAWEPQNNIFGSYLMISQERQHRVFEAEQAARDEAAAGGGFTSAKACREAIGGTSRDIDGDGILGDVAASCNIVTPGSVVEELTRRAVTADIDFIINADQLSTYLAAIADAVFNRLIRDGVAGLRGLSTNAAPGSDTPNDPSDDFIGSNNCNAFGPELRAACEGYVGSNNDNFIATQNEILADIGQARRQYDIAKEAYQNSIVVSNELVEFLNDAPNHCTSQSEIDRVEAKIVELEGNIVLLDSLLSEFVVAEAQIRGVALNDWAALTQAVNAIELDIDFIAASDIAAVAVEQEDAILIEIGIIEDRVNICS